MCLGPHEMSREKIAEYADEYTRLAYEYRNDSYLHKTYSARAEEYRTLGKQIDSGTLVWSVAHAEWVDA